MSSWLGCLSPWLAALWWGSLTTVGFGVVPMLFANLPTLAMAGSMVARLFAAQTWVALVCGLLLLLNTRANQPSAQAGRSQTTMLFIVAGMLAALLSEFAVAPHIIARDNLRLWHSLGTGLYVLQWLCAGMTFKHLALVDQRV